MCNKVIRIVTEEGKTRYRCASFRVRVSVFFRYNNPNKFERVDMIVDRVINNNIVSTIDDEGAELILMGRGLGFGAKSGNDIDESKVEKIFKLEDQNDAEQLKQLLLRVPLEEAEVVGILLVTQRKRLR